jgi:hypothetical protein
MSFFQRYLRGEYFTEGDKLEALREFRKWPTGYLEERQRQLRIDWHKEAEAYPSVALGAPHHPRKYQMAFDESQSALFEHVLHERGVGTAAIPNENCQPATDQYEPEKNQPEVLMAECRKVRRRIDAGHRLLRRKRQLDPNQDRPWLSGKERQKWDDAKIKFEALLPLLPGLTTAAEVGEALLNDERSELATDTAIEAAPPAAHAPESHELTLPAAQQEATPSGLVEAPTSSKQSSPSEVTAELPSSSKLVPSPDAHDRKTLYRLLRSECKTAGVKMDERTLAKRVNPNWNTRDPIAKWKQGKDRRGDDTIIRDKIAKLRADLRNGQKKA